ncbi:MAG: hypothetical protein ABIR62_16695 [Dokdonella sp.]|uniref:hypothetical protein n=1 Tax=Dokdonella sp. TaxID=2291710 RepID=UPI003266960C
MLLNQRHPVGAFIVAAVVALGLVLGQRALALDFTPHGTQPGLQWPLESASTCADCHRSSNPANAGFMPHSSWGGSMMANATRDPLFWAALDIANKDAESIGKPGVGDYCLRCHTPAAWLKGDVVKDGAGGMSGPGGEQGCQLIGNYARRDLGSNDYSGVDCHFCHRLTPTGPNDEPGLIGNANTWLDDSTVCTNPDGSSYGGPCRRGPYPYTSATDPLQPPHGWTYSKHHTQSAICGSCHDITTPDTDEGPLKTLIRADGSDSGRPFPIERTFTEWNRSLFADAVFRDGFGDAPAGIPALAGSQQCQDCHMRTSVDPLAKACDLNPSGSRTNNLPVHEFVGANTWIPAVIKGEYGEALQRPEDFDQTIEWARASLQSSATVSASVTAYTAPAGATAGALSLTVKVTNLSGHKLPTGYSEGRRMWINVEVRDATNQVVAQSGAYDGASALLAEDAQARVYEILQGIWDTATSSCKTVEGGRKQFHFVLNNCVAKDNRIPPLGMKPKTVDDPTGEEVAPVGQIYPETSPGSGVLVNMDTAPYAFVLPASSTGPFTATATLRYQTSSREYIEFLRDEAVANATPGENTLCSGGPNRPFTVGPQERSRGEFAYQLWNNAPDDATQPGYGKSPPEAVAMTTVTAGKSQGKTR